MKSLKELARETVAVAAQRKQEKDAKRWKPSAARTAQEHDQLNTKLRRLLDKPSVSSDKLAFFGAPIFDIVSEEDETIFLHPAPGSFVELRRSVVLQP